jgi:hypothetical protein
MKSPQSLRKSAWLIAIAGWVLCLVVAGCPFVGLGRLYTPLTLLLLVGAVPLLCLSVPLLTERMSTETISGWKETFFANVPSWFLAAHGTGLILTTGVGLTAIVLGVVRHREDWIGLLFVLVPFVFYFTCIGVFWSAVRESQDDA